MSNEGTERVFIAGMILLVCGFFNLTIFIVKTKEIVDAWMRSSPKTGIELLFMIMRLIVGPLWITSGIGVLQLQEKARKRAIFLQYLSIIYGVICLGLFFLFPEFIVNGIFNIILALIFIYYLNRPTLKAQFKIKN